mmetsp:Transcript_22038/g.19399  ORF Transcript_22038/g.19399 Transcript_22038/m.19399 type:complete len:222 (-) Transcript_22038:19-684(-)
MEPLLPWIISILLLSYISKFCKSKSLHYRIEPDDPGGPFYVRDQNINDSFIFEFEKFETNTKYQVIISFPGYLPIECRSNITQENAYERVRGKHHHTKYNHHSHSHSTSRRLLDTFVDAFWTGNRAKEQTIIKIVVKCHPINQLAFDQMVDSGSALKSHRKAGKVDISKYIVQFGIKVESLWFGFLPSSLIGLAIAAIIIIFIVIFWVTPFILRNIKPKNE